MRSKQVTDVCRGTSDREWDFGVLATERYKPVAAVAVILFTSFYIISDTNHKTEMKG